MDKLPVISVVGDRASGKTTVAIALANRIAAANEPLNRKVLLVLEGPFEAARSVHRHALHSGVLIVQAFHKRPHGADIAALVVDGRIADGTTKLITLTNFEKEPYRG